VLAELGLVGASLLSAVLLVLLVGLIRGLVARPELLPVALGLMGLLLHFGLDIDARYPALLGLVGILFGLIYTQGSAKWVAPSWKWPAVAALVLIPLARWYLSDTWAARGRSAQDDGDYALAAADFGRADQQFAFNPDVLSAEGINLYSLAASGAADGAANSSLALERARHAQQLDPHDGQHHQLEGRILALRGDLPAAELAFKQALRLDRFNHPDYALDLASILVREQKTDAAVSVASDMLKLYPLAVVNNRASDDTLRPTLANLEALIGNVHLAAGRIGEAGAAADRALALDPKSLRGRALKHQTDQLSSQNTAQ
jgi:Flp pilus assembly protein TadD